MKPNNRSMPDYKGKKNSWGKELISSFVDCGMLLTEKWYNMILSESKNKNVIFAENRECLIPRKSNIYRQKDQKKKKSTYSMIPLI